MPIDISDLDKAVVLAALFNASRPQGLGFIEYDDNCMTVEQARVILDTGQTHFNYLQGRVMKVVLKDSELDPWLFDRDNGEGAALTTINTLRVTGDASDDGIKRIHEYGRTVAADNALQIEVTDEATRITRVEAAKWSTNRSLNTPHTR
jgi:hypothetical protein